MTTVQIFTVLAPLGFIVGFALQKGNICSVLAAREIVQTGKWVRLRGLLLTSAWGFAILLPLTWLGVGSFQIASTIIPGLMTVLAGVTYALGCFVIGACIFGVCSRTTAGHISFAFAIPAMAVGATLGQFSGLGPKGAERTPSLMSEPDVVIVLLWLIVVSLLIKSGINVIRAHRRAGISFSNILAQGRWRSAMAAMIIGMIGALLFATDTAWFYPAAVKRIFLYITGLSATFPIDSIVGGGALFVGGTAAALYKGRVVYRAPHLVPSLHAIAGGLIIGFAWALIPGGNDAMVLYLAPSLALHGLVAYITMFLSLIAIEYVKLRYQRAT